MFVEAREGSSQKAKVSSLHLDENIEQIASVLGYQLRMTLRRYMNVVVTQGMIE